MTRTPTVGRRLVPAVVALGALVGTLTAEAQEIASRDVPPFPALGYHPLTCAGADSFDPRDVPPGPTGPFDIVGEEGAPALQYNNDGRFLYLRLIVTASAGDELGAITPGAWAILFDGDGDGAPDVRYILDGSSNTGDSSIPDEVRLERISDLAGTDAEVLKVYEAPTHGRSTRSTTTAGGTANFYITLAAPIVDFYEVGLDLTAPVTAWGLTLGYDQDAGVLSGVADLACATTADLSEEGPTAVSDPFLVDAFEPHLLSGGGCSMGGGSRAGSGAEGGVALGLLLLVAARRRRNVSTGPRERRPS